MNNNSRTAVREQRVRIATQVYILVEKIDRGFAFAVDREVIHVARMMAIWILQPVLLAVGIEVWTGRLEIRPVTLRHL